MIATEGEGMLVEVKLFARFREGRFKEKELEVADGSTVADVLEQVGIPKGAVGMRLVNGKPAPVDTKLAAKDVISVFPAIGGG